MEGESSTFHVSVHHQSSGGTSLFAVYALVPDGIPVATIKMGGIGQPWTVGIFRGAFETGTDVTIDLDALAAETGTNKSPLYYTEEQQQTRFQCRKCKARIDIFGQYGFCSSCGQRNTFAVLDEFLSRLRDRVTNPRYPESDRAARDSEWREITKQCVSHFEGFGRDLIEILVEPEDLWCEGFPVHNSLVLWTFGLRKIVPMAFQDGSM